MLVTGGAGFIGCALAPHLLELGLPVVAVDNLLAQVHPGQARPAALPDDVELVVGDVADPAVWDGAARPASAPSWSSTSPPRPAPPSR